MTYTAIVNFKDREQPKYVFDLEDEESINIDEDFIFIGEYYFVALSKVLSIELTEDTEVEEDSPDIEGYKQEIERLRAELAAERLKKNGPTPNTSPYTPYPPIKPWNPYQPYSPPYGTGTWTSSRNLGTEEPPVEDDQ